MKIFAASDVFLHCNSKCKFFYFANANRVGETTTTRVCSGLSPVRASQWHANKKTESSCLRQSNHQFFVKRDDSIAIGNFYFLCVLQRTYYLIKSFIVDFIC